MFHYFECNEIPTQNREQKLRLVVNTIVKTQGFPIKTPSALWF